MRGQGDWQEGKKILPTGKQKQEGSWVLPDRCSVGQVSEPNVEATLTGLTSP